MNSSSWSSVGANTKPPAVDGNRATNSAGPTSRVSTTAYGRSYGRYSLMTLDTSPINPADAAVTVGPKDALERYTLTASKVNWMSGEVPLQALRATAQIRYRHREAACRITPLGSDRVELTFDEAQSAVTPGQAVVFYDGDVVLGGGWID